MQELDTKELRIGREPPRLDGGRWRSVLVVAVGWWVGAGVVSAADDELLVFAAASTTEAVTEVAELFSSRDPGPVRLNFAASSTLARQIAEGAKADVFLSANPRWMDYLDETGWIVPESRVDVLRNRLVLIAPRGRAFPVRLERGFSLADAFPGKMALADPDHVPAGQYAREALVHLGAWDGLSRRVVAALDVRAALALVERGECAAGVVYSTDAQSSPRVETLAVFPEDSHGPIVYPAAAVRTGNVERAQRFLDFLGPSPAGVVFREYGFLPAPSAVESPPAPRARSPKLHETGLLSAAEVEAMLLSLRVGLVATFASLPFGLALGWLLARRRFPGKLLLEAVLTLPLVMPPVVTGYLLLLLFGANGFLGRWLAAVGVSVAFNWQGAALAAAVVGFPLMVRAVRLSVEAVDPGLEAAARTLGAGPWRVFYTVTLPLSLSGVLAGMLLCFARSLGEFGATITFVGNVEGETRTLPLAIFTRTQVPGAEGSALRLAVISVAVALLALVISEYLARRSRRRLEG